MLKELSDIYQSSITFQSTICKILKHFSIGGNLDTPNELSNQYLKRTREYHKDIARQLHYAHNSLLYVNAKHKREFGDLN